MMRDDKFTLRPRVSLPRKSSPIIAGGCEGFRGGSSIIRMSPHTLGNIQHFETKVIGGPRAPHCYRLTKARKGAGKPALPRLATLHTASFFMLNYDAMKRSIMKRYATLLVLAVLASACSGPVENQGSSNTNAPPAQANSNSAPQPQIAQGNPPAVTPGPAPPTVQQIPAPPAAKSAAAGNANAANGLAGGNARAPKLVAPEKQIDFGKQPQNKNLVRPIVIKNGGRADLNIESVVPS